MKSVIALLWFVSFVAALALFVQGKKDNDKSKYKSALAPFVASVVLLVLFGVLFESEKDGMSTEEQISSESTLESDEITSANSEKSTPEDATLETIYKHDAGINRYLNNFNKANPDDAITSDMATPYHHHGSDHMDQIQFCVDDFEVTITGGAEVYIGYTPGTNHTNDEYKEMFKKYVRGFDLGLTDEQIEADWNAVMEDSIHDVRFDKYECDINMFNDNIEYLTINLVN